ncbi:MAG TPA: hypothetical protein VMB05_12235 [Solirubrobacteraceae bacterium]|nr:hypothetical protein [Solirubrobacteraceae bacterium]
MTTQKQRAAARENVKKAQSVAKSKQTLKHLTARTRAALGKEANKVRSGKAETRKELEVQASRLQVRGRSKMGKDELRRAIAKAR